MGGVDGLWHRQVGPGRILEDSCIGRAGQTRLGPSNSQVWQVGKGIWRGGPGRLTRLGTAEGYAELVWVEGLEAMNFLLSNRPDTRAEQLGKYYPQINHRASSFAVIVCG